MLSVLLLLPATLQAVGHETVRAAAEAANVDLHALHGVFVGDSHVLHVAPDGRYTRQMTGGCGFAGPMPIDVGRWWRLGETLVLGVPVARISHDYDPVTQAYVSRQGLPLADPDDPPQQTRLLLLPLDHGLRLMAEDQLPHVANWINAEGGLPSWGVIDRGDVDTAPAETVLTESERQRLPAALRALLRDVPVHAGVSRAIDPASLVWKSHEAELLVTLDRGLRDGLFVGMELLSDAAGGVYGTVESVDEHSATLRMTIERFHPGDTPMLPLPGDVFSSESGSHASTGSEPVAPALQGNITTVSVPSVETLHWDDDGYAFMQASIDIGARDGLAVGDHLSSDDTAIFVEGRVTAVAADHADVLLRLYRRSWRGDPGEQPSAASDVPGIGSRLATPAWFEAEWEAESSEPATDPAAAD